MGGGGGNRGGGGQPGGRGGYEECKGKAVMIRYIASGYGSDGCMYDYETRIIVKEMEDSCKI